ncbi:MAG TPA: tol-pal system protein YbgF [Acidiferrobacteraceae bacterium]|nr:tol-pal system protein YbgF [Acidiferrobacteraceae bacterium]HEX20155.1 tol-pal system protein YbgF [Acidiferrobacteraceae bacterium]
MVFSRISCGLAAALLLFTGLSLPVEARRDKAPVVSVSGNDGGNVSRSTAVDLLLQMDRLQKQIQQLRNQVEILTHEVKRLKKRQQVVLGDIDRRVSVLERGVATSPKSVTGNSTASAGAATVAVPGSANESKDYDTAFNLLKQGYYSRAAKAFSGFVRRYPNSALVSNARYWVGESYYVLRNFKLALTNFRKVLDDHPKSRKVSDALLKIGFTHYEMKNWGLARESLRQVVKRYPKSRNAKSAQIRLNKMKPRPKKIKSKKRRR